MEGAQRAEAPVAKVDFVTSVPQGTNVETASPQPANHALVAEGAVSRSVRHGAIEGLLEARARP